MKELEMQLGVYSYDTCREFVEEFELDERDLIVTRRRFFAPYFGAMGLRSQVVYLEECDGLRAERGVPRALVNSFQSLEPRYMVGIGNWTVLSFAGELAESDGREGAEGSKAQLLLLPATLGTETAAWKTYAGRNFRTAGSWPSRQSAQRGNMVLVPELLEGLPYEIFAIGTLDALEKAFMVILAPEATAYETLFGEKAVELTLSGYQKLLADGSAARLGRLKDFLIASNLAGTAYTGVWSRSRALPQERRGIPLAEVDRYFEGNRPENEKLKKQVALALRCTPEQAREEVKFYIKKIRPPDRRLKNGISRAEQITLTNRMVKMQDYFVGSYLPLLDIDQVMEIYRALY